MATKKNLNNPDKNPGEVVKTRSVKSPASSGGKSSKLQQIKGGSARTSRPGKKVADIIHVTSSKGKSTFQVAKKMIKSGSVAPSSGAQKSTKKGAQLEDNKSAKKYSKMYYGTKNPDTLVGKKRSAETYQKNSEGKSNYGRK